MPMPEVRPAWTKYERLNEQAAQNIYSFSEVM